MSKSGHPTPVTAATLALQDAHKKLVLAMKDAGASDQEIDQQLMVSAEQARLIRGWAVQ